MKKVLKYAIEILVALLILAVPVLLKIVFDPPAQVTQVPDRP